MLFRLLGPMHSYQSISFLSEPQEYGPLCCMQTVLGAVVEQLVPISAMDASAAELSYNQASLLFVSSLDAASNSSFNIPVAMKIGSKPSASTTDPKACFLEAVQLLCDRHASLRTAYATSEDGAAFQTVHVAKTVDVHECGEIQGDSLDGLKAAMGVDAQRPFNLAADSMLRVHLYRSA